MSARPAVKVVDVSQEFPFSPADFKFLAKLLYDTTGITLNSSKMNMVYSRLAKRLRELRLPTFADYCELLESPEGASELGTLINALTTNLTRFFREPHHFDHLKKTVLPTVAARNNGRERRLRIWSAGCSSGEEPYTIAMCLAETLDPRRDWDAKILATDLDTNMVATGRNGLYSDSSIGDLPDEYRRRFFDRQNDGKWQATDLIRQYITFKQLNLMEQWPVKGPFDAIFCRNVMIYFDGETKNRLVERYTNLLAPGGWLYVGHSETLLDNKAGLVSDGRTIYRKAKP